MKRYLIKLSQPVIVDDSTCKEKKQTTIYGFLGPVVEENKEPADYLLYDINSLSKHSSNSKSLFE